LIAVQDGIVGEQRQVRGGIAGAGGRVGPGEQVQDVEAVSRGESHRPAAVPGRSQRWT
jgi:hypothetical protein